MINKAAMAARAARQKGDLATQTKANPAGKPAKTDDCQGLGIENITQTSGY